MTWVSIETPNVTGASGDIVVNASAAARDFQIVRSGASLAVIDITNAPGGPVVFNVPFAGTTSVTVNGTAADDNRLVVDFTGGYPLPTNGVAFNGGVGGTDRARNPRAARSPRSPPRSPRRPPAP